MILQNHPRFPQMMLRHRYRLQSRHHRNRLLHRHRHRLFQLRRSATAVRDFLT